MKIIPNQKFIHERVVYEPDQEYEVEDALGYYFEKSGWVGEKTPPQGAATLTIHDGEHGHESEV